MFMEPSEGGGVDLTESASGCEVAQNAASHSPTVCFRVMGHSPNMEEALSASPYWNTAKITQLFKQFFSKYLVKKIRKCVNLVKWAKIELYWNTGCAIIVNQRVTAGTMDKQQMSIKHKSVNSQS